MSSANLFQNTTLSMITDYRQQASSSSLLIIFGVLGTIFAFANISFAIYQYHINQRTPEQATDTELGSLTDHESLPAGNETQHHADYDIEASTSGQQEPPDNGS
ncbi:hypothetical protein RRF57_007872 [Xylaria bambusicola]|uniref:Uncharacterized protein n=1 Tax=Xylaria bambusicola TaxID=326684 RepID=A0AAN7ULT7_9PEZI